MKETTYKRLLQVIQQDPIRKKLVTLFIQYSPWIDICLYPLLLVDVYFRHHVLLLKCILIPAISFISCTMIRKKINAPRPYDLYAIEPLHSHSSGNSCPSRHTLSAFAIGYCVLFVHFKLGIFALLFALLVGISRIIGALHFPSDVFYGFLLASFWALFYFI